MIIKILKDRNEIAACVKAIAPAFRKWGFENGNFTQLIEKFVAYAVFIGCIDDSLGDYIGYCALYANDEDTRVGYISMFGVLDAMQGKHVGKMLMDRAIQECRERGMRSIRLEVNKKNLRAIGFYKKNGFIYDTVCSEESDYYIVLLS